MLNDSTQTEEARSIVGEREREQRGWEREQRGWEQGVKGWEQGAMGVGAGSDGGGSRDGCGSRENGYPLPPPPLCSYPLLPHLPPWSDPVCSLLPSPLLPHPFPHPQIWGKEKITEELL